MFKIIKKDKNSLARVGVITTAHGEVETPAYAMVATRGEIKTLNTEEVYRTGTQLLIANTFHLWQEKLLEIESAGGIHKRFGWEDMPLMTDSGGFQVFSFGFAREHHTGKVSSLSLDPHMRRAIRKRTRKEKNTVTITDAGVRFAVTDTVGKKKFCMLTPARSIEIQKTIGADLIFAFDECTSPFHDHQYNAEALERTHRWATLCLEVPRRPYQKLYGIVQGGEFRDLREKSAKFLNSLPFDAFGIGGSFGISSGRNISDVKNVLQWTLPYLDERKPRHLLGIGMIQDIFDGISCGVDTFDCVIPTREGRHGSIWTRSGRYDVRNASQNIAEPLEAGCECDACLSTTKKALREMFRSGDYTAGRLATIHNMFFFNRFMADTRNAIREGAFERFRNETIGKMLLKK